MAIFGKKSKSVSEILTVFTETVKALKDREAEMKAEVAAHENEIARLKMEREDKLAEATLASKKAASIEAMLNAA